MINGYVYNVISYECEDMNVEDIFYMDTITQNECCLRLYNFEASFYVCQPPGMDYNSFGNMIETAVNKYGSMVGWMYATENFIDNCCFSFNHKYNYVKVFSVSSSYLAKVHKIIKAELEKHYTKITCGDIILEGWDKVLYDNTESPFRFDMTTLNANNIKYFLSTKYNIPCVGGIEIDIVSLNSKKYNVNSFGFKLHDKKIAKNTYVVDMKRDDEMFKHIKYNESIDGSNMLTLMSYDIETYKNNISQSESEKYIMCIGVGFFKIHDPKPFKRYCLTFKDLNEKYHDKCNIKQSKIYGTYKEYIINNEYTTDDENDNTCYLIFKGEKQMMMSFIALIQQYKPQFITGFNNYGFDDIRMFERISFYKLEYDMVTALNYYENDNTPRSRNIDKFVKLTFKPFSIKIDGEMYNDNYTWRGNITTIFTDTYKIILATDPKLYTQQGRGNLDTMLEVNDITNPFNEKALSKTGLTYDEMWNKWDNNEDIYDVLFYCTQDAWITGTLLIKKSQLIDKIEMSILTHTTICDSIYNAVTWRVKHLIENYAWRNNFAVCDTIISTSECSRSDYHKYGNKQFDTRTIVGGEVKSIVHGRQKYIIALDFASMYPSQKEGSNIDTSSNVDITILNNLEDYGLHKYHEDVEVEDMYNKRIIKYIADDNNEYVIEEFHSVFKNNKDEIRKNISILIQNNNNNEAINDLRKLLPSTYKNIYEMIINHKDIETIMNAIPDTETKRLFTVQSPRDKNTNLVTAHYSLKEIMLSDLRALRNIVKKQMSEAKNVLDKNRYNAKQNAIKIMMNSEYGASNSSYFPYYDTLIGGATTAASRNLIGFLTHILDAKHVYVSKRFINDNKKYLDKLSENGVVSYEPYKITDENFMINNRRNSLREIFDKYYNVIDENIFVIHKKPSTVVYQDTDSNYYTNEYIRGLWKNEETPEIINKKMNLLLLHNELFGNFIKDSIYRKPCSVSFEGAFIIARYFDVKKKYYGVVWNDKMQHVLQNEAYNDNILIEDYSKYWKPSKYTLPLPNGDYIKANLKDLIKNDVDVLKFVKSQNIKLTGVDLARRDQYKFINFNHIMIIKNDLHFLQYDGNNKWKNISDVDIKTIIINMLSDFHNQFKRINNMIIAMKSNTDFDYDTSSFYDIHHYAKYTTFKYNICAAIIEKNIDGSKNVYIINEDKSNNKYTVIIHNIEYVLTKSNNMYTSIRNMENNQNVIINTEFQKAFILPSVNNSSFYIDYDYVNYTKKNDVMITIGNRYLEKLDRFKQSVRRKLTNQEFNDNFPSAFKREQYIVMNTEASKRDYAKGLKSSSVKTCEKAFLIEEKREEYKKKIPEELYNTYKYHNKIPYEKYIDLNIIIEMDVRDYEKAFASAVSLYLVEYANIILGDNIVEAIKTMCKDNKNLNYIVKLKETLTAYLMKSINNVTIKPKYKNSITTKAKIIENINNNMINKLKKDKELRLKFFTTENIEDIKRFNNEMNNDDNNTIITLPKQRLINDKTMKAFHNIVKWLNGMNMDIKNEILTAIGMRNIMRNINQYSLISRKPFIITSIKAVIKEYEKYYNAIDHYYILLSNDNIDDFDIQQSITTEEKEIYKKYNITDIDSCNNKKIFMENIKKSLLQFKKYVEDIYKKSI